MYCLTWPDVHVPSWKISLQNILTLNTVFVIIIVPNQTWKYSMYWFDVRNLLYNTPRPMYVAKLTPGGRHIVGDVMWHYVASHTLYIQYKEI